MSKKVSLITEQSSLLDEDAKKFALENLNETEANRTESINKIRQWLDEDVPWLCARKEDKHILPFLRGCKFDLNKTKTKMLNFYQMKRDRPEWFKNRNPQLPELETLIKLGIFVPLKLHYENKLVVIIRTAGHDPKKHTWNDVFKIGKMILDVACMEDEYAQIYGVIALFDMTGIGFAHYRTMTPLIIKHAVYAWQNYHLRPKQLEFFSSPTYINIALNIFKRFMTSKMQSRVKVYFGGIEKAQEIVPKSILPSDYGGEAESLSELGNYWYEKLSTYSDWFADDEQFKAL